MRYGSLFSGVGGFDLGFDRAGMTCAWQVEIDPFCQKILQKHWPDVARFSDVREVGRHNLEPVDVIIGGFPCQPHSLAGKRKGAADDRNLWPEYRRIIGELYPSWIVGENVVGIKTTILDDILSDLESMDYQTRTLVIPACAFGAPHIRERIFVVANSNGKRSTAEVQHFPGIRKSQTELGGDGEIPSVPHASRGGWTTRGVLSDGSNKAQSKERDRELTGSNSRISAHIFDTPGAGLSDREQGEMGRKQERYSQLQPERSNWWAVEPGVDRVAHGVPGRVDRIRALGNAIVPQVAEWIGRGLMEVVTSLEGGG